jgi:hypothetical protein
MSFLEDLFKDFVKEYLKAKERQLRKENNTNSPKTSKNKNPIRFKA